MNLGYRQAFLKFFRNFLLNISGADAFQGIGVLFFLKKSIYWLYYTPRPVSPSPRRARPPRLRLWPPALARSPSQAPDRLHPTQTVSRPQEQAHSTTPTHHGTRRRWTRRQPRTGDSPPAPHNPHADGPRSAADSPHGSDMGQTASDGRRAQDAPKRPETGRRSSNIMKKPRRKRRKCEHSTV